MFYLYILQSIKSLKYYIGCTNNIKRRLIEHNSGLSKYTKNYIPWKLIYQECYNKLTGARAREKQIKSWKKRSAIERLIKTGAIV